MQRFEHLTGCLKCSMGRRNFLSGIGCAACASASGALMAANPARAEGKVPAKRIRILFALHAPVQSRPDWPNVGFDFQPVMDRFAGDLRACCLNFEFVTSMVSDEAAAKLVIAADAKGSIDGYIVYQLNCWNRVVQTAVATGKPTLYVDFSYGGSGGMLVYTSQLLTAKASNFGFVASPRIGDIAEAVQCFAKIKPGGADFSALTAACRRQLTPQSSDLSCATDTVATLAPKDCLARLRKEKLLVVTNKAGNSGAAEAIKKQLGIEVVWTPFEELNDLWKAADKDQVRAIAERWQKTARAIVGVSRETLENSAAMYLGEKALLNNHGANALTVNCLGGFYGGQIQAYPCLGFYELNNEGLIGGCEADVRSAVTMITMNALTKGRPGYISDPVLDTSKRQIIYAHCVASNKPFGPQGTSNPYEILTHSEDRQGAAVRSYFPLGHMTTTVEFDAGKKAILFHQAKTVANVEDDRACRTKIAAEPLGDFEKLFTQWGNWGWHRVTVFGDLKEPVFALANALGWEVIQEA